MTTKTLLAASLSLGLAIPTTSHAAPTTFVHLFEWSWSDIAQECEQFLGPKGYAAVQVSPPNEHIQGSQWWTRYQPVSYELTSRGGNRSEFIDMVQRCGEAGVDIYVDTLINHMAAGSGVGTAGHIYGDKYFPGYSPQDFHTSCAINPEDYGNDRWRVQHCELVGLADLDTDAEYVQNTLANYINSLQSLGVKGFRFDAAKHVAADDIASLMSKVVGNPVVFQEVIDQGGEAVSASEYLATGLVTEFKYSTELGNTFRNGKLAWLSNFGEGWGFMPSSSAVVFVDNHDNQRGHGGGGNVITYADGRLYDLANVFMLAYPYGYPKVMSSYDYHGDTDAGGPSVPVHNNGESECFGSNWQCEHRWSYIAGGVDFRNNTTEHWQVTQWWDNGNNQIAFGRADAGHVAINKEEFALQATIATDMAPGRYCNVLKGALSEDGSRCSAEVITVQPDGTINLDVAPWDAMAIHHQAKLPAVDDGDWQRTVIFINAPTASGEDLFLRGGIDHHYANTTQGRDCQTSNYQCAMPIRHNNLRNTTTAPWKINDNYLDWYGAEAGQSSDAPGSATDWTTDLWPSDWGTERTVSVDGYGVTALNTWGPHYWMLDVEMDCSRAVNGWFEIKAFVRNGQGWEGDINQPNSPYASANHFAQCGKINTFEFNSDTALIQSF